MRDVSHVLDIVARSVSTLAAIVVLWALITERLVPRRRVQEVRDELGAKLAHLQADNDELIAEYDAERKRFDSQLAGLQAEKDRIDRERERLRRAQDGREPKS